MAISDDPQARASRPASAHLRRTKLMATFAVTVLVGVGSYAATYRSLDLLSASSPTASSTVPATSGSDPAVTVPSVALPVRLLGGDKSASAH